jgi:PadR family transcriptional regulator PadR
MDSQFKKGILKLCVMAKLDGHDMYGYEIVSNISKLIDVSEGTIYPLLRRLKNDGSVETYLIESKEGPSRKYYKLTKKGKDAFTAQKKEWIDFSRNVSKILGEKK